MWSFRRFIPTVFALSILAVGGGCGFQPMYGSSDAANPGVSSDLAKIRVQSIPNREGQLLHNALLTRLTPRGPTSDPVYSLSVSYTSESRQIALQRDSTATRQIISYTADYKLTQDGKVVTRGEVTRTIGLDYLAEHYANVSAEKDAQARSAKELAEAIVNELAAYFIRRGQALDAAAAR
ncbi:hypothetical protein FACS1894205_1610 [Alphaproteobacteria bacterium]|nr:hypothetical protein FACS1894205_1610 [Alphaproteobacteria bacterium]